MSHRAHVIVVGAGIGGLAAALGLLRAGQRVTLLDVLPMPIGIAKVDRSFLPLFPSNE